MKYRRIKQGATQGIKSCSWKIKETWSTKNERESPGKQQRIENVICKRNIMASSYISLFKW